VNPTLRPHVGKCPAKCGADVLLYYPSRKSLTAKWAKPEVLEIDPTEGGTWSVFAARAYDGDMHIIKAGHRLLATKLTSGQVAGAKRHGLPLHEPHSNYCGNGGRKPRK
jgi:hypothetical protein